MRFNRKRTDRIKRMMSIEIGSFTSLAQKKRSSLNFKYQADWFGLFWSTKGSFFYLWFHILKALLPAKDERAKKGIKIIIRMEVNTLRSENDSKRKSFWCTKIALLNSDRRIANKTHTRIKNIIQMNSKEFPV